MGGASAVEQGAAPAAATQHELKEGRSSVKKSDIFTGLESTYSKLL